MIEYKISPQGKYGYLPYSEIIVLGGKNDCYDNLNDNELLTSIADSITHEYIHYLLHKKFNLTVCKLFDTIGKYFYTDYSLMDKVQEKYSNWTTWEKFISINGINAFYKHYGIDSNDILEANEICGGN